MTIILRNLILKDKNQFLMAVKEKWENDFHFAPYWTSLALENYEKYMTLLPLISKGEQLPAGHVPCTILFAFDSNEKLVGRTSIRHHLNDELLKVGGHIGYGIVPGERKKGHATSILKESLLYIKNSIPAIEKALVTCDEFNIGSRKTIEKNEGILENIVAISENKNKMRFWISLR